MIVIIIAAAVTFVLVLWAFYALDRREKNNAYWRAVATEQARRIEAGRKLYEKAVLNRKD